MLPLLCAAAFLAGAPAPLTSAPDATPPARDDLLTPFVLGADARLVPGIVDPEALPSAHSSAEAYAPNLYRRFTLGVGVAAYDDFNTNMQVAGDAGLGATLDLEEAFDIDTDDTIARFDAQYSFNRRHRIDLSYYDIRRGGSKTIAEDIQIGDEVIPAGSIDTKFNTQIIKLAYRYNFVADERTVIGASFGAHFMGIDLGVENEAFAVDEDFKANAPLPLIGLHAAYALSDTWSLNASLEFLKFDIDAYRGFISDSRLTIEHDTFEHFGWGLGYNGFRIDGSIEGEDDLRADLEYGYAGLMLYLRGYL